MIKSNKKAVANARTSTTAKNVSLVPETLTLSDKIKILYRFICLPKTYKGAVYTDINTFSNYIKDVKKKHCLV